MGGGLMEERIAGEALVLMAVGLTAGWKVPISFHFTKGCSASTQKQLLLHAIEALQQKSITVKAITMDGCAVNVSTAKQLGCDLNSEQSHFKHDGRKIYLLLDACHMLKVLRNTFHDLAEIVTEYGVAKWSDIVTLVNIQKAGHLHLANKLTRHHTNYENNKMKVKLAAQVFSQSTADALLTLKSSGQYPELSTCEATANFLKVSNTTFTQEKDNTVFIDHKCSS